MKGLFYMLSHYLGSAAMCLQMVACSSIEGEVQAELVETSNLHQISKTTTQSTPSKNKVSKQFASSTGSTVTHAPILIIDSVYICKSRTAYAYHSGYCGGLKRCRSEVGHIPLSTAKELGYKACGYCY
ncbi:MAG TPA: hypothetical protein VGF79_02255 [Bacteroidia bacterium]